MCFNFRAFQSIFVAHFMCKRRGCSSAQRSFSGQFIGQLVRNIPECKLTFWGLLSVEGKRAFVAIRLCLFPVAIQALTVSIHHVDQQASGMSCFMGA